MLKRAEDLGVIGGTVLLGEGTVRSKVLDFLGVSETHKEILVLHGTEEFSNHFHDHLTRDLQFYKRNKGIAFTIPFIAWNEQSKQTHSDPANRRLKVSHTCIMTVVDKGNAKQVMEAARSANAFGGTVIHGRGAGIPADSIFPMMIEPEKDVVMIVSNVDKSNDIRSAITQQLELDQPGTGIVFSLPITKVSGLYEERQLDKQEVAK